MAELGSLSLELTRLGQIVAEPKYYDAIARITYELAKWQDHTRIPGLWPTVLDASGCERIAGEEDESEGKKGPAKATPPKVKSTEKDKSAAILDTGITAGSPAVKEPGIGKIAGFGDPLEEGSLDSKSAKNDLLSKGSAAVKQLFKRAADGIGFSAEDVAGLGSIPVDSPSKVDSARVQPADSSFGTKDKSPAKPESTCTPQGLTETDPSGSDVYTLGAAADSTYEYLPKMYLLLGARSDDYRKMYVKAADAAIKHLIYRPMIPDETREILFAGNVDSKPKTSNPKVIDLDFKPVMTHLTCFVGGMFGMASKIFDRPQDLELARKLTDGCIWAYNVTASGIMPEIMGLSKCDSTEKCKWDKVKYYKELDPMAETRTSSNRDISKPRDPAAKVPVGMAGGALQKRQYGGGEAQYGVQTAPAVLPAAAASIVAEVPPLAMGAAGMPNQGPPADQPAIKLPTDAGESKKLPGVDAAQQYDPKLIDTKGKSDFSLETKDSGPAIKDKSDKEVPVKPKAEKVPAAEKDTPSKAKSSNSGDIPASAPLSHEEFVKKKIEDERLPLGVVGMYDKKYELRPEAIESVFYMYRITGEQYWRDRGWEMWNAVYKHTKTPYGASTIEDVSKKTPATKDREESFWMAETLKYFYLLFDDPDKVSLDDWVLNTEAHFLTRLGA